MIYLYVGSLVAGLPLLLWLTFAGGEVEADVEAEASDGFLSYFSITTLSMLAAFFGGTGLILELLGTPTAVALILAVTIGLLCAVLNTSIFRYIRKTEASSEISNSMIEGSTAKVIVPITQTSRGRVKVTVGGTLMQLTAEPMLSSTEEIEVGASVLIVEMKDGVASVDPLHLFDMDTNL